MVWPDCFRLYILLQKRVDIFLRQTCKWIFLSFPHECELFLIPFPQKHEKCAFIISMATCIVPVTLLICNNTTSVTDTAVRASLWSSLQEFTVILQKSSGLSRARLGSETEVLHGPPPSFPIPPTPGYHCSWFTLSTRVSEFSGLPNIIAIIALALQTRDPMWGLFLLTCITIFIIHLETWE